MKIQVFFNADRNRKTYNFLDKRKIRCKERNRIVQHLVKFYFSWLENAWLENPFTLQIMEWMFISEEQMSATDDKKIF